jgi:putative DNA primase/helicase
VSIGTEPTVNGQPRGRATIDEAEVARAASIFFDPNGLNMVQSLPDTEHAYVSADTVVSVVAKFKGGEGIYWSVNSVPQGLDHCLLNVDVARRRWFLIDVDRVKQKGNAKLSATDAEKDLVRVVAFGIADRLTTLGWPAPVVVDSGNGYHLYYQIDLPEDEKTAGLLKRCLEELGEQFDTDHVEVDQVTFDARRISKLPGTWACKGLPSIERPHRLSQLVVVPDTIDVVSADQLHDLAGPEPAPAPAPAPAPSTSRPTAKSRGTKVRALSLEERIVRYLNACDPAISGQRGHDQIFKVACNVGPGFNLTKAEAIRYIKTHYNSRCQPEWSDREIEHKVDSAYAKETRRGWLLNGSSQQATNGGGHAAQAKVNEADNDPARLARLYLRHAYEHPDGLTLRYWGGTWMAWTRGAWRQLIVDDLEARVVRFVKAEFDRLNVEAIEAWEAAGRVDDRGQPLPKPVAMKVTGHLVANVVGCLSGYARLDPDVVPPSWLSGIGFGTGQAHDILPTCNALVDLTTLISGASTHSVKITPRFFNGYALDYRFNLAAPRPSRWLTFLDEVLPNDPQSIDLLQEFMGHLLTPDTSYQKILFIVGARRSGKGTICRLITGLIGAENVANPTLSSLGQNFGLEALIGKPASIITDARLSRRTDSAAVVERLLSISGEDSITIDRKFHKALPSVKLPTRFVLVSNELPQLNDASGALASRLLLLNLTESFLGREDRTLTRTLMAEREGILLWAIGGWARLRQRGHFVQPEAGREAIEQLEDLVSPVGAFLKETCEIDPVAEVTREDLFSAWKTWCQGRGRDHHGDEGRFGRDLRAAFPKLGVAQHRTTEGIKRFHRGLRLLSPPSAWGKMP